ncbi:MAG: formate dehydrogenase accessory protein FdhE [Dehalococcoidia bacterium]|nr:MAG: formate dehydrogenase accessory protein FdhE [Dehalococcoidia bacterium]
MPVETDAVISFLEEKERKEGTLPKLLEFYRQLLRVQSKVEKKLASRLESGLSREVINKRISNGIPLIAFDELALDWQLLTATFDEIKIIFAHYAELFNSSFERLVELSADALLTEAALKQWFEKQKLPATISVSGLDKKLTDSIIHATIKPFLISHAGTLRDSIEQERWRRGYCPICGGSPDFALLDAEHGSRWLLCSRCDTEWVFQRLQCPYCNTQDQNDLCYFTEDTGQYRLYICERCKKYLKTVDLRQTEGQVILPLERFHTLDMDRQAVEMGYKPYHQATRVPKNPRKDKKH